MLAAKRGRQEQLEILEAYLAGEPVEFKSHQGKGYETQRDPDADNKTRAPTKIVFEKQTLFLDAAGLSDVDTGQSRTLLSLSYSVWVIVGV